MLRAPEFFQITPAQQNSPTSRPSLLRKLRLPLPVSLRRPLPERLPQLREEKRKPSDKEFTTDSTILWNKSNLGFTPPALPRAVTQRACINTKVVRNTIRHAI